MFNQLFAGMSIFVLAITSVHAGTKIQFLTEEYPPYNFKGSDGKPQGISVDLLEMMFDKVGTGMTRDDVKIVPWARGYRLTQQDTKQNVLFSTTRTPEREALFKWVGPIAKLELSVFALKEKEVKINSDSELQNYKFAVIREDITEQVLKLKGVPNSKMQKKSKFNQMVNLITKGRADVFAYPTQTADILLKKSNLNPSDFEAVYKLMEGDLYYAFNTTVDDGTVEKYQKALDDIVAAQPELRQTLWDKHVQH